MYIQLLAGYKPDRIKLFIPDVQVYFIVTIIFIHSFIYNKPPRRSAHANIDQT